MAISTIGTNALASSAVTSANMATAVTPLGVGQTWQNLTASRALSTTYTNTTGRPIYVAVIIAANGSWSSSLTVSGLAVSSAYFVSGGGTIPTAAVVPNGATYVVASGVALSAWYELR